MPATDDPDPTAPLWRAAQAFRRATAAGRAMFTPSLAGLVLGKYRRIARRANAGTATPGLSERETEVLRHVAEGLSAEQVATKLSLSHRTVENHVQAALLATRRRSARHADEYALLRLLAVVNPPGRPRPQRFPPRASATHESSR